jgi:UDP-N-acetylglucosamine 2-epimerase (non-hydrolysing)
MSAAGQRSPGGPVMVCFGTRPEVVKLARVIHRLDARGLPVVCVATGQHREMLDQMLDAFDLVPDFDLDLMTPDQQLADLTGRAVVAIGQIIDLVRPRAVLVQGDTTTAMCAALAAFYARVPVGHVEAGLRTGDLDSPFPEEANRRLIGQLARWHFCPTEVGRANLRREGVADASIAVTGNTGIDAARWTAARIGLDRAPRADGRRRALETMHRRESQGHRQREIGRMLSRLADRPDLHVLFPVHPSPAVRASIGPELSEHPHVTLCDPLGYADFIGELAAADLVLTDSGGVQEEAPAFDVPVVVMRELTERPEGVAAGCALLCGTDADRIYDGATRILDDRRLHARMAAAPNPYGDGLAAERIVARLAVDLAAGHVEAERRNRTFPTAGRLYSKTLAPATPTTQRARTA